MSKLYKCNLCGAVAESYNSLVKSDVNHYELSLREACDVHICRGCIVRLRNMFKEETEDTNE